MGDGIKNKIKNAGLEIWGAICALASIFAWNLVRFDVILSFAIPLILLGLSFAFFDKKSLKENTKWLLTLLVAHTSWISIGLLVLMFINSPDTYEWVDAVFMFIIVLFIYFKNRKWILHILIFYEVIAIGTNLYSTFEHLMASDVTKVLFGMIHMLTRFIIICFAFYTYQEIEKPIKHTELNLTDNVSDKFFTLKELADNGLITEEEYNDKRKELIDNF